MQQQNIKPIVLVPWHVHPDAITPELKMHALVLDIADAVESKVGVTFAKEDGADCDAGCWGVGVGEREVDFAHVVEETRDGEDVERAEGALLRVAEGMRWSEN